MKIRNNKLEKHKIFCSQNQPNIFKVYTWFVPFILMNMRQICFYPFRFSDNLGLGGYWKGYAPAACTSSYLAFHALKHRNLDTCLPFSLLKCL